MYLFQSQRCPGKYQEMTQSAAEAGILLAYKFHASCRACCRVNSVHRPKLSLKDALGSASSTRHNHWFGHTHCHGLACLITGFKCAPGAPDSMDLSQSQDAPRAAPAAEDGAGLPRKLARARMPSPPCARNIFMDGPEDEPNEATQLTRRPPYVSRYRCLPPKILCRS